MKNFNKYLLGSLALILSSSSFADDSKDDNKDSLTIHASSGDVQIPKSHPCTQIINDQWDLTFDCSSPNPEPLKLESISTDDNPPKKHSVWTVIPIDTNSDK